MIDVAPAGIPKEPAKSSHDDRMIVDDEDARPSAIMLADLD